MEVEGGGCRICGGGLLPEKKWWQKAMVVTGA